MEPFDSGIIHDATGQDVSKSRTARFCAIRWLGPDYLPVDRGALRLTRRVRARARNLGRLRGRLAAAGRVLRRSEQDSAAIQVCHASSPRRTIAGDIIQDTARGACAGFPALPQAKHEIGIAHSLAAESGWRNTARLHVRLDAAKQFHETSPRINDNLWSQVISYLSRLMLVL